MRKGQDQKTGKEGRGSGEKWPGPSLASCDGTCAGWGPWACAGPMPGPLAWRNPCLAADVLRHIGMRSGWSLRACGLGMYRHVCRQARYDRLACGDADIWRETRGWSSRLSAWHS